jgi:hypothetical protein
MENVMEDEDENEDKELRGVVGCWRLKKLKKLAGSKLTENSLM